jgi:hypothetical protein
MRRTLTRVGGLVALVTAAIALSAPVATAADETTRGVIVTPGGADQPVYTVESPSYHIWKRVPYGTGVHILCQTLDVEMSGTFGRSKVWDFLTNAGWVPHVNVDVGSPRREWVEEQCEYVGAPPRANPYGYHKAIDRAFTKRGSSAFENRCLAFVAEAYGWDGAGWATAEIAGDWMQSHGHMRTGTPPRGALVWYHNSSGTGHVMLSLGEGYLIGTSVNGEVGLASNVNYRTGYRGWSIPYFPSGWGSAPW